MQSKQNSFSSKLIQLNLAILFISTSGVLGRYIEMPIAFTIGSRALLAAIILYIFCKRKGFDFNIASKDSKTILLGGLLMGGHWLNRTIQG